MEKRYSRPKAFSSSTSNILAVLDEDGCKRSCSEVDISRGFIPSDMKDPNKKKILNDLTQKIFLSSDEEKLKKKKREAPPKKCSQRPKYFFEKNGSQFVNTPVTQQEDIRSHSKKRNPHQMYTDSSVYQPKHHPSIAEQVKMAHQLSSSLFDDANKKSTGQEMFFKRVKTTSDPKNKTQSPSRVPQCRAPNMKLVMNPEGKLHDWTELPKEDISELSRITSSHFSSMSNSNERPNYSSYKDIFESRRNIFSSNKNNMDNDCNNNSQWNRNMNAKNCNINSHKNNKNLNHHNNKVDSSSQQNYYKDQRHFSQNPQNYDLLRSKTAPSIPRPHLPKRGSSKHAVAAYDNRPPLERFFV